MLGMALRDSKEEFEYTVQAANYGEIFTTFNSKVTASI
jgi:hypothetical protein